MQNKNVLITGGASGLGKILSTHLAQKGFSVIVLDRMPYNAVEEKFINTVHNYIQFDLNNIMKISGLSDILSDTKIDILINNASMREFGEFYKFEETNIKRILNVNLTAPILLTNFSLDHMIDVNYGRIINISSKSGFWGYSTGTMYCSTKSALIKFTEALSKELCSLNKNITANVICPDSFSDNKGNKFKKYQYVISSVIKNLDTILETKINGKCFTSINFIEKVVNIAKYTKQQFKG